MTIPTLTATEYLTTLQGQDIQSVHRCTFAATGQTIEVTVDRGGFIVCAANVTDPSKIMLCPDHPYVKDVMRETAKYDRIHALRELVR